MQGVSDTSDVMIDANISKQVSRYFVIFIRLNRQ